MSNITDTFANKPVREGPNNNIKPSRRVHYIDEIRGAVASTNGASLFKMASAPVELDGARVSVKLTYNAAYGVPDPADIAAYVQREFPNMMVEAIPSHTTGLLNLVLKAQINRDDKGCQCPCGCNGETHLGPYCKLCLNGDHVMGGEDVTIENESGMRARLERMKQHAQMDAGNLPAGTAANPVADEKAPLVSEEIEGTGKIGQVDPYPSSRDGWPTKLFDLRLRDYNDDRAEYRDIDGKIIITIIRKEDGINAYVAFNGKTVGPRIYQSVDELLTEMQDIVRRLGPKADFERNRERQLRDTVKYKQYGEPEPTKFRNPWLEQWMGTGRYEIGDYQRSNPARQIDPPAKAKPKPVNKDGGRQAQAAPPAPMPAAPGAAPTPDAQGAPPPGGEEQTAPPMPGMSLEDALDQLSEAADAIRQQVENGDTILDGQEVTPAEDAPQAGTPPVAPQPAQAQPITAQKEDDKTNVNEHSFRMEPEWVRKQRREKLETLNRLRRLNKTVLTPEQRKQLEQLESDREYERLNGPQTDEQRALRRQQTDRVQENQQKSTNRIREQMETLRRQRNPLPIKDIGDPTSSAPDFLTDREKKWSDADKLYYKEIQDGMGSNTFGQGQTLPGGERINVDKRAPTGRDQIPARLLMKLLERGAPTERKYFKRFPAAPEGQSATDPSLAPGQEGQDGKKKHSPTCTCKRCMPHGKDCRCRRCDPNETRPLTEFGQNRHQPDCKCTKCALPAGPYRNPAHPPDCQCKECGEHVEHTGPKWDRLTDEEFLEAYNSMALQDQAERRRKRNIIEMTDKEGIPGVGKTPEQGDVERKPSPIAPAAPGGVTKPRAMPVVEKKPVLPKKSDLEISAQTDDELEQKRRQYVEKLKKHNPDIQVAPETLERDLNRIQDQQRTVDVAKDHGKVNEHREKFIQGLPGYNIYSEIQLLKEQRQQHIDAIMEAAGIPGAGSDKPANKAKLKALLPKLKQKVEEYDGIIAKLESQFKATEAGRQWDKWDAFHNENPPSAPTWNRLDHNVKDIEQPTPGAVKVKKDDNVRLTPREQVVDTVSSEPVGPSGKRPTKFVVRPQRELPYSPNNDLTPREDLLKIEEPKPGIKHPEYGDIGGDRKPGIGLRPKKLKFDFHATDDSAAEYWSDYLGEYGDQMVDPDIKLDRIAMILAEAKIANVELSDDKVMNIAAQLERQPSGFGEFIRYAQLGGEPSLEQMANMMLELSNSDPQIAKVLDKMTVKYLISKSDALNRMSMQEQYDIILRAIRSNSHMRNQLKRLYNKHLGIQPEQLDQPIPANDPQIVSVAMKITAAGMKDPKIKGQLDDAVDVVKLDDVAKDENQYVPGTVPMTYEKPISNGVYTYVTIAWDPDDAEKLSGQSLALAVRKYVSSVMGRREVVDFGFIGAIHIDELDAEAGTALVHFRAAKPGNAKPAVETK